MSRKVLVIGATGQLGSRLADDLCMREWGVFCSSRSTPRSFYTQIPYLATDPPKKLNFDAIIDCVGPRQESLGPESERELYGFGRHFDWINELARANPGAKVVRLSSCKVYDYSLVARPHEGSPLEQRNYYSLAHQWAERQIDPIENRLVLRLSNSFGTPGREGSVNNSLVTNHVFSGLARFGKVVLSGNPKSVRNFFPATLLADAINWALIKNIRGTYNLASPNSVTLEDWVEGLLGIWKSEVGRPGSFQFVNSSAMQTAEHVSADKWAGTGHVGACSTRDELVDLARYFAVEALNE